MRKWHRSSLSISDISRYMNTALDIAVPSGTKIAVVGDIHEHEDQFDRLINMIQPSEKMLFVSVGDIYDKGFGPSVAESITDKIKVMNDSGFGFVVRGNHELKNIRKAKAQGAMSSQLSWLERQPLALSFVFSNQTRLTIVHGGVKPKHQWDDLNVDVETSYIRTVDENGEMIKLLWMEKDGQRQLNPEKEGVSWHEKYDGRFGYIAAGHEPLKDGKPRFYNYSCNLDTACYCTGILTCQIFTESGLDGLHSVAGASRKSRG